MPLTILNTREVKKIKDALRQQFGHAFQEDYAYLQNDNNRVFIITKDVQQLELKNLKIDKMGLYAGEVMRNGEFRLSKEGAQLLVREAQVLGVGLKNTIELSEAEVKEYFSGNDLDYEGEDRSVLLLYQGDTLGWAKLKDGKILNFLPKIHRGTVIL